MSMKIPNLWIIDDDPMSSFYIKRLAQLGELANIITIYNAAQGAIDYLLHHRKSAEHLPDIILLDIYMPEVDGWEFLNELKKIEDQLSKKAAIYIISSSSHPKDVSRAETFPEVRSYFKKPVTLDVLKEMVSSFLKNG
ncbi:MAG: response regulator [Cyclobacteriaceae bacterium]|nr:response regulator [Cyclobacteriaceae bacterium]MDH4296551.1 response regulator [Cyclobacteriaceae bacterium]MDH5250157.1 response regulator [Cyclobacteriaceae bacterium]